MPFDNTSVSVVDHNVDLSQKIGFRRVRVLYLDHTAKIGGGEIAITNLVRSIDHDRFQPVFVLSSDGPLVERLKSLGVETHVLELDPNVNDTRKDSLGLSSLFKFREALTIFAYIRKLVALMHKLDVDLVHTNSLKAHIYGGVAARLAGLQVVWHIRDAIDDKYLPGIVAATVRFLARHIPNYIVANSNSTLGKLELKRTERTAVVYSGIEVAEIRTERSALVVHDGCDPDTFDSVSPYPDREESGRPAIVTMVGRIAEWKGQHIFLRAAAKVKAAGMNVKYQIVGAPLFGEFEYEKSLYALTEELGLGDVVEFLGFRDDVPLLVADCDILVHASIIGEPFGQVVIEGMFSSKPVIATNGGALPEIVIDGVTGYLVSMGSVDEMADAIQKLLTNPIQAMKMGVAGRMRVLESFTLDRCAAQIHGVYEKMLQNSQRATVGR